jgi:hypothetical protein
MDKAVDAVKLSALLEHWMGHNRGHVDEFAKWAARAREAGHDTVSQRILEAAGQMDKANEILQDALSELGGA